MGGLEIFVPNLETGGGECENGRAKLQGHRESAIMLLEERTQKHLNVFVLGVVKTT
jgi:hypothetical protein